MVKNVCFIAAAVTLFTMLSVFVSGDYVLEVHVMSYSNPTNGGEGLSGGCCDGGEPPACTGNRRCDTYFRFCLRPFNTPGIDRGCGTSAVVTSTDSELNNGSIDFTQPSFLGLDNPLSLSGLAPFWQGVQLYVETIDRDGGLGGPDDDFIDSFDIDINSQQPVGALLTSPNGVIGGVHGYGIIGLTGRVLCAENYYGDLCQFLDVANQCLTNSITCSDQGTCVDGTLLYTCNCNPGYTGTNCEFVDNCLGVACNSNGICQNGVNTYTCECTDGFTGTDCEQIDYCFGFNCSENGSCQNEETSYTCDCGSGYTGMNCETNINDCEDENCDGHGTCQDLVDDFRCVCDPGYTGRDCEIDIKECEGQECNGNGQCVDLVGSFNCSCDPGYTGGLCEININDCVDVNCSGNGQCMDGENEFTCLCVSGFTGDLCSVVIETSASIGGAVGGALGAVVVIILVILLVLLIIILILKHTKGKNGEVIQAGSQYSPGDNPVYGIPDKNVASEVPPTNARVNNITTIGSDVNTAEFDNPIYGDNDFEGPEYEAPPTIIGAAVYEDPAAPVYAELEEGNSSKNGWGTHHYDPNAEQLYQNVNA